MGLKMNHHPLNQTFVKFFGVKKTQLLGQEFRGKHCGRLLHLVPPVKEHQKIVSNSPLHMRVEIKLRELGVSPSYLNTISLSRFSLLLDVPWQSIKMLAPHFPPSYTDCSMYFNT